MGDINADLLKPLVQPGKALRSTLKLANTRIESTTPTRIQGNSATCLDIIAVDTRLECSDYRVADLAASDHFPVMASVAFSVASVVKPIIKRNISKINWQELGLRIEQIELNIGKLMMSITS